MTCPAKITLTFAIAMGTLTIAFTSQALADQPVVVRVVDGTHYTAEVSDRTDGEYLWLAFRTRSTEYLRPLAWDRITAGKWNGESLSGQDLRQRILSSPDSVVPANQVETPKTSFTPQGKASRTLASEALDLLFAPAKLQKK